MIKSQSQYLRDGHADGATRVKGALDFNPSKAFVEGWLALLGDSSAREAVVQIGDRQHVLCAAEFRADLRDKGINAGHHAFSLRIPLSDMDGKPRTVTLTDAASGVEVARRDCAWPVPEAPFHDFQGFLCASMTQPIILLPFLEEHREAFTVMDAIADRLCARAAGLAHRPLVSVVMPVFNREDIVGDAIRSVLTQDYEHLELLVVDDGSSDTSASVAEAFGDSRVRVLRLSSNEGHSAARNAGLAAAQGAIVAYLDSDNRWDRRYLGAVVGAFEEKGDADALYSGQLLFRGSADQPFGMRYGHFHRALLENRNYVDLNAFAHRRVLLDRMEGFDVALRRFVDYDFVLRASEVARMISVPVLLSHYFQGRVENTVSNDRRLEGDLEVVWRQLEARLRMRLAQIEPSNLERPVNAIITSGEQVDDLRACLTALARQQEGASKASRLLDIAVVDRGSSPLVSEELRALAATGWITLVEGGRNADLMADPDQSTSQGRAPWRPDADLLLLSSDVMLEAGALVALQQAAYALPEAGMVVPRRILPGGTPAILTHVPQARGNNACCVILSAQDRNIAEVPTIHDGGPVELTYAPFFAVYIRHDLIAEIGRPDIGHGGQQRADRAYCDLMRAVTQRRLYYVPDAFTTHEQNGSYEHHEEDWSVEPTPRPLSLNKETRELDPSPSASWDVT